MSARPERDITDRENAMVLTDPEDYLHPLPEPDPDAEYDDDRDRGVELG